MAVSTTYATLRKRDFLDNAFNQKAAQQSSPITSTPVDMFTRPQTQAKPNTQAIQDYTRNPLTANIDDWRKADDARMAQQTQAMSDAQAAPPGGQIVHGANIQSDIPSDNPPGYTGVDASGNPPAPVPTVNAPPMQQATVAPLPVTPPTKPNADEAKSATPEQKEAASASISALIKSRTPTTPVAAATLDADHEKIQNDVQDIAKAKDPQKAWQNLQEQPFYKNSSFYNGLVGVGLSIMSGKSPVEAFQTGMAMNQQDDLKKQLQFNRNNLIDQGYAPDSIANAIAKGDPSLLKMKQMSDQQKFDAQENAYQEHAKQELETWKQQNQITNDQANARLDTQFANGLQLAKVKADTAEALLKMKADTKAQANSAVNDQFGGITPTAWSRIVTGSGTKDRVKVMSNRAGQYQTAEQIFDRVQSLSDAGKYKEAGDAWNQGVEWMARGIMGKDGMLDRERINELTGFRDKISQLVSNGRLNLGVGPGKDLIGRMKTVLNVDKEANDAMVQSNYRTLHKAFMDGGMNTAQASVATNKAFASYPGFNPDEMGIVDNTSTSRSGVLGDDAQATADWMTQE